MQHFQQQKGGAPIKSKYVPVWKYYDQIFSYFESKFDTYNHLVLAIKTANTGKNFTSFSAQL